MEDLRVATVGDDESRDDDLALVRAAIVERAAFAPLYDRYAARVYRYMRTRIGSDEDAADLAQQTFLQALAGLGRYRGEAPFSAWLFGIARNVAVDAHRRGKSSVSWELLPEALHPASGQDPEAVALRREELVRLRGLLEDLDSPKRELLRLRFAGGLTAKEIGAVVGKSHAAVQKEISRLLRQLEERYRV